MLSNTNYATDSDKYGAVSNTNYATDSDKYGAVSNTVDLNQVNGCRPDLGYPSPDDNNIRLYSQDECYMMNGIWSENNYCGTKDGDSYSKLCAINNLPKQIQQVYDNTVNTVYDNTVEDPNTAYSDYLNSVVPSCNSDDGESQLGGITVDEPTGVLLRTCLRPDGSEYIIKANIPINTVTSNSVNTGYGVTSNTVNTGYGASLSNLMNEGKIPLLDAKFPLANVNFTCDISPLEGNVICTGKNNNGDIMVTYELTKIPGPGPEMKYEFKVIPSNGVANFTSHVYEFKSRKGRNVENFSQNTNGKCKARY